MERARLPGNSGGELLGRVGKASQRGGELLGVLIRKSRTGVSCGRA